VAFDSFDGEYVMSVGSRFLLESLDETHAYGCRAAAKGNLRKAAKLNRNPLPIVKSICYALKVVWAPEDGEDAHFHIELQEQPNALTNKQKRNERAVVSSLIAECLFGPNRHICSVDEEVRAELERIEIAERIETAEVEV
jgi:hypothetical protein